jgi:hypothetical protein
MKIQQKQWKLFFCKGPLMLIQYVTLHGEVYSIQHYVIKFLSDLWNVNGFLQVLWFPPLIKLIAAIGHKSLTNLHSEMIFLQGKPVFCIFLPSTPPYWQIILRFCWQAPVSQSTVANNLRSISRVFLNCQGKQVEYWLWCVRNVYKEA